MNVILVVQEAKTNLYSGLRAVFEYDRFPTFPYINSISNQYRTYLQFIQNVQNHNTPHLKMVASKQRMIETWLQMWIGSVRQLTRYGKYRTAVYITAVKGAAPWPRALSPLIIALPHSPTGITPAAGPSCLKNTHTHIFSYYDRNFSIFLGSIYHYNDKSTFYVRRTN